MRYFHKLDISFLNTYKEFGRYDVKISFGLYNVNNRTNPYLYFIGSDNPYNWYQPNEQRYPGLKSLSKFHILPSFTWSVKF